MANRLQMRSANITTLANKNSMVAWNSSLKIYIILTQIIVFHGKQKRKNSLWRVFLKFKLEI